MDTFVHRNREPEQSLTVVGTFSRLTLTQVDWLQFRIHITKWIPRGNVGGVAQPGQS